MSKFLMLVFLLAFFCKAKGQDTAHIYKCDSAITIIHSRQFSGFKMAGNAITYRIAMERLKMFKSSAHELEKAKKLSKISNSVLYPSLGVFMAGDIVSVENPHNLVRSGGLPISTVGMGGCVTAIVIAAVASKHMNRAFKLYNKEICTRSYKTH